jgi:hypothetical protein
MFTQDSSTREWLGGERLSDQIKMIRLIRGTAGFMAYSTRIRLFTYRGSTTGRLGISRLFCSSQVRQLGPGLTLREPVLAVGQDQTVASRKYKTADGIYVDI